MARLGWPEGHGERLRKERREFAREEADTLAKSLMAGIERRQLGETRRTRIAEAGLGRRLGREQEFARPLQTAEIGRSRALAGKGEAEAEKVRYGTEFQKGVRGTIEDILEASAAEAKLGITEEERRIRLRDEAEIEAAKPLAIEEVSAAPEKPTRKLRPSIKRFLWEGQPEIGAPGLLAPIKGWHDISKLLREGLGESYEYAFPRGR